MTTYNVGPYEFTQAWYSDYGGNEISIYTTDDQIVRFTFAFEEQYFTEVEQMFIAAAYIHEVYDWNTGIGAWILNTSRYTEQLKSQLNSYKRELLNDPNSTVTLVNPDTSEVLGVETDQATTFAVKMQADLAADKTPIETDIVGYHFDVFTPVDDVDIGSRDVTTKYLKNLLFKLNDRTQKHFRAENHVMQLHGAIPYTDHTFAIPKADLLDYVNTP